MCNARVPLKKINWDGWFCFLKYNKIAIGESIKFRKLPADTAMYQVTKKEEQFNFI